MATKRPEKGQNRADLMKLVEAAYNEGMFTKSVNESVKAATKATPNQTVNEVSITFTFPEKGTARARQLYELAKNVGV